jgi:hypothetical protein
VIELAILNTKLMQKTHKLRLVYYSPGSGVGSTMTCEVSPGMTVGALKEVVSKFYSIAPAELMLYAVKKHFKVHTLILL